jgi:hypothetical protein
MAWEGTLGSLRRRQNRRDRSWRRFRQAAPVDFTAGVLPGSVRMNLEIEAAPMEQLRFSLLLALCRLDIADGGLAGAAILLGIEGDLLALDQPRHPGALERGGMDENVLATIVRLNEAEAFLVIVEFHGARIHRNTFR